MIIFSMFIEALILKAPDGKVLYIWKTHWKALFLQALSFRFIKQRTFSSTEIEKVAGVQRKLDRKPRSKKSGKCKEMKEFGEVDRWPITFIVKEKVSNYI